MASPRGFPKPPSMLDLNSGVDDGPMEGLSRSAPAPRAPFATGPLRPRLLDRSWSLESEGTPRSQPSLSRASFSETLSRCLYEHMRNN